MKFLEKNPNVLVNMLPDEINSIEPTTERSRHAITNYRALTGISAPGRGKKNPGNKPNDLIAPWKMGKRNRIINKDLKPHIDNRAHNISSKRRQALPTNTASNISNAETSKRVNKQKVKIPKVTNRDGINSQPAGKKSSSLQKKIMPQKDNLKPNINTAKNGGFGKYQTPSFVSPMISSGTDREPSFTQSSYSQTESQFNNNGSSMVEKHTIIFESETEDQETESEAETESQYLERKQTIHFESSTNLGEIQNKDYILMETDRRNSSKVESSKPKEFHENSSKNLATFRANKVKSQSDVHHDDVDLEEYQNDARYAKTALNQNRIGANVSKITVNHVGVPNQVKTESVSRSESQNDPKELVDENLQTQLEKLNLTPSEKEKLNDEIYLNTNSAEENPDLADNVGRESNSVSKHTLDLNTEQEYDDEGESRMSQKEAPLKPVKVDQNHQISSDTAPKPEKMFTNKSMQISAKDVTSHTGKSVPLRDHSDGQSEYINREMNKLQNNNGRRERFKSNANVPVLRKFSYGQNNNLSHTKSRYSNKKPFEYIPESTYEGNADIISQISEERKLPERITHTRARMRAETQDYSVPDFGYENRSVEYRPPVTPPDHSIGIQPSQMDRSAGIQMSRQDRSAGVQMSNHERSAGIQLSRQDRSAGVQMSRQDRSAGIQYSDMDQSIGVQNSAFDKSAGVQYSDQNKSQGIQPSLQFERSQGIQPSQDFNRSQGIQPSQDFNRSAGVQYSQEFERSAGMQVGDSLENPSDFISVYDRSAQYDEPLYSKGIQADEEPLKDIDVQCDMSENNKGIQAEANLVSRGNTAGSDSLRDVLMSREIEIVDKITNGDLNDVNDNQIDFSCQFSYHTIASTEEEKVAGKSDIF